MSFDIENNDAFSVRSLTGYFDDKEPAPSHLGSLGVFEEEGIRTRMFAVEQNAGQLNLVPTKPADGIPTPVQGRKGKRIPFETARLPLDATVRVSELAGARKLGTEGELKSLTEEIQDRQDIMQGSLDATHEHFRVGAVKGEILDADGLTVVDNLFDKFGLAQTEFATSFSTASTNVHKKSLEILNLLGNKMRGMYFMGARVIAGENFFSTFATHSKVADAFARYQEGAHNFSDPRNGFKFANMTWEQYFGQVGDYKFIGDDEAYVIPMNTRGMFKTYFSPMDHIDFMGEKGRAYYTSIEALKHGGGFDVRQESNIFCLNRNPAGVIKLSLGS